MNMERVIDKSNDEIAKEAADILLRKHPYRRICIITDGQEQEVSGIAERISVLLRKQGTEFSVTNIDKEGTLNQTSLNGGISIIIDPYRRVDLNSIKPELRYVINIGDFYR